MFEVRVEADFAAAHFLRDYNGKCENLHGHNYKVFAHVRGSELNEGGMLMDFSRLKAALRAVCKELDHTNLNDLPVFDQNPSAERIAVYIYKRMIELLNKEGLDLSYSEKNPDKTKPTLFAVDVFETETSRARYSVI
ncbi:MAG: 6-carboxytetrahydropterin synthase QueD [Treponema sp.]|jgi:6-pyruvoyltetrahydropterin/6-carboxytetrahydropterin synthase|nr:6-carboxytetrahydropterin synthase QueD [Treponema sp.]